jgi:hypothetical protein
MEQCDPTNVGVKIGIPRLVQRKLNNSLLELLSRNWTEEIMAKVFFTLQDGSPRAVTGIRRGNDGVVQELDDALPDGDTVGVQLDGTGGVRFLGIDTPEKSFEQPLGGAQALNGQRWEEFLTDPFAAGLPASGLEPELREHLKVRVGSGAAANHHTHAVAAGEALKKLIRGDMTALSQDAEAFSFFLSFSYEVFDIYGRFLAFINRNQPDANNPGPRPDSYNLRMLELGMALPYIIWPNVSPFRDADTVVDAVPGPGTANVVGQTGDLKKARDFVKAARSNGVWRV